MSPTPETYASPTAPVSYEWEATDEAVAARYTRYGDLKEDLATLLVESLAPIQARYAELLADPGELHAVAARGAVKAAEAAGPVYRRAARAMGLS